jgi:hypothetical protein
MATKPNIDRLYEKLFSIKEMLTEVIQTANEAANDANAFGGEIARVIPNQLRTLLVPALQQYIDSPQNPVAMDSIVRFLDSLPLSKVRVGRQEDAVPGGAAGAVPGAAPMSPYDVGTQAAAGFPPPSPTGAMTGVVPNAAGIPEGELYESQMREYFHTCPKCGAEIKGEPECPECGWSYKDGSLTEAQSAILQAKGQPLLDVMKERWEEAHAEKPMINGVLDFRAIKEGYQRKPPTPEVFSRNNEEKIYNRVVESSNRAPTEKLQEADMLAGPYARTEVSDMSGWRDLVESHVNDEEINERLGAGAVASAMLSEQGGDLKSGIARMKELVTKEEPGTDARDLAQLLVSGRLGESAGEFADEINPARVRGAMQEDVVGGDDLAALVHADTRELS